MLYKLHWLIVDVFINETRDVLYIPTNVTCEVLYALHWLIILVLIKLTKLAFTE